MVTIIGVRFRVAGKIYYFDPGALQIGRNGKVIVETARGLEMGTVMVPNKEVAEDSVVQPLKAGDPDRDGRGSGDGQKE